MFLSAYLIINLTSTLENGHVCGYEFAAHYNDVIMDGDGVSNHQPHDCLLNRLFRRKSKKTFPHKWPVTQKIFPFDDVIMPEWVYSPVAIFDNRN